MQMKVFHRENERFIYSMESFHLCINNTYSDIQPFLALFVTKNCRPHASYQTFSSLVSQKVHFRDAGFSIVHVMQADAGSGGTEIQLHGRRALLRLSDHVLE